jgi:ribosomal 50S subunit-associated protein YjgA (DUF615 family)
MCIQTRSTKPVRPNPFDQNPANPLDHMTSVREELQYVLRSLNEKRTRLIQEVREMDRNIALLEYLNTDNRQLRTYVQSTNRRQREESQPHCYKRVHSPTFSEGEEDGELSKM